MYAITAIFRITDISHTKKRTRCQLDLQGDSDRTLRLPFMLRMALTKCNLEQTGKKQHRHQHWSVRDAPPLLGGTFLKVHDTLEEGAYYSIRVVPNCCKSGLSQYAYYVLDAVKLESLPAVVGHTIEEVANTSALINDYPQLAPCLNWYSEYKRHATDVADDCDDTNVFKATIADSRQFLCDFVQYISDLYTERPNTVLKASSVKRNTRRGRKFRERD
jgi:hypothetical protein